MKRAADGGGRTQRGGGVDDENLSSERALSEADKLNRQLWPKRGFATEEAVKPPAVRSARIQTVTRAPNPGDKSGG